MSADAASLPCPICLQSGIFVSVQSLRDRLIYVSTNKILCPVCQEEVSGLDKLTIHLFSHVKLLTTKECDNKNGFMEAACKPKPETQVVAGPHKKSRGQTAKNKSSTSTASVPVKFVKIYPKLPVMPLNAAPVLETSREHADSAVQVSASIKTEAALLPINTTCEICGLQFVDSNILQMHRCLIHNIDDNSNQNVTKYQCHLCPKNFKMRGSLMVHLRVAHYGFQQDNSNSRSGDSEVGPEEKDLPAGDKLKTLEKNDNKQWQCDVCRKCFTTKYFLKKHKRLHTVVPQAPALPQRREAPLLRTLRPRVQGAVHAAQPPAHSHRRKTLLL
ncbi:hypothetical protein MSG28_000489 [Choristoneura fumiferana]|uniref:Uncharacterized protein n=1 Tax=Choristoneura fumiferana TaxID=7141 RepID=A0ACC0K1A1_CHOFU|nr:hypothetical protein MSG28_000489 [Choristoneura fumiferana]